MELYDLAEHRVFGARGGVELALPKDWGTGNAADDGKPTSMNETGRGNSNRGATSALGEVDTTAST
jgi:hypothetical protein